MEGYSVYWLWQLCCKQQRLFPHTVIMTALDLAYPSVAQTADNLFWR